jgi:hypothetical protein
MDTTETSRGRRAGGGAGGIGGIGGIGGGRRDDRGQAVPLAAAMVALAAVTLLALVPVGAALDRRTRARTSADAAALAGAAEGEEVARRLAEANGGELVDFEADGDRVVVEVRVGDMTAYASARARRQRSSTSGGTGVGAVPGGLATVSCPTGGSVTVAASIAENVRGLFDLAGRGGVPLCGWGYRDSARQVQLRREHCGTSEYAIYRMPASQCSPPTARPGASMHEQGLAIDFTCDGGSIAAGGSCDNFLKSNADDYGLRNLPSEIWHYSTNGR